jgi:predicted nucleic acid-binding Zn ribbon protein
MHLPGRALQSIGDIVAEVISRRGLGRTRSDERVREAWRQAAGTAVAARTEVGPLRHGVLEIRVANSVLLQELASFQKQALLGKLRLALDTEEIRDLKFRVVANL